MQKLQIAWEPSSFTFLIKTHQTYTRIQYFAAMKNAGNGTATHQSREQPPANTSAVDWMGVFKILGCELRRVKEELLILALLCDQTMSPWPNQSFGGSRWHFVGACCQYCVLLFRLAGSWLRQPAHRSGCVEKADEREQDYCSAHAGVQSCLL